MPEVFIKDIIPDTVITAPWSQGRDYNLDVDNDNDINFRVFSDYIGGGMVLGSAGVNITTLNSELFVITDSTYPYVLSYGDTIKINDKWGKGNMILESYWQSYPPGSSGHSGNWYGLNNKYMGVKFNNRLGWIKLDTYTTSLKVCEYALQK